MKEIQLTQGKVALVDDEDFERLNQFKWSVYKNHKTWYASRKNKQQKILMHREIMNAPKHIQVDHRNGDGLFNCKKNLRLCTHQQNQFNQKHAQKNNKLGIKGVRWRKDRKKFEAQIRFNGKAIYLGRFAVLADADQAYRVAELKHFKEFARA